MSVARAAWSGLAGLAASAGVVVACPNLSGTYLCPAWQTQPPQTLIVSNTLRPDGSAAYKFRYISKDKEKVTEFAASSQGITGADGYTRTCTSHALVNKGPQEAGTGTANFINPAGDFEAKYNGVTAIVCTRRSK
jgi:hypothetical protein